VQALSTLLSKGYGRDGVRSNLVAPGLTRTHATEDLLRGLADEHGGEAAGVAALSRDLGMALPRVGEADEVAALVVYLAGDLAAQITGAVVRIDGGAVPTM
jgi:3-oxoacyl-[acyl-carrier protein] reductase